MTARAASHPVLDVKGSTHSEYEPMSRKIAAHTKPSWSLVKVRVKSKLADVPGAGEACGNAAWRTAERADACRAYAGEVKRCLTASQVPDARHRFGESSEDQRIRDSEASVYFIARTQVALASLAVASMARSRGRRRRRHRGEHHQA